MVCDGTPYYENPGKQCNQAIGSEKCHVRIKGWYKKCGQEYGGIFRIYPIFLKIYNRADQTESGEKCNT